MHVMNPSDFLVFAILALALFGAAYATVIVIFSICKRIDDRLDSWMRLASWVAAAAVTLFLTMKVYPFLAFLVTLQTFGSGEQYPPLLSTAGLLMLPAGVMAALAQLWWKR